MPRHDQRVSQRSDRLCECGCGQFTYISPKTRADRGWVKGEPRRFLAGHYNGGGPGGGPGFVYRRDYVVNELTGCWVWQRGLTDKGYGWADVDGERVKAHRLYYMRSHGPIPAGYVVHHLCANRRCVNPDHLQAILPAEHNAHHARLRHAA